MKISEMITKSKTWVTTKILEKWSSSLVQCGNGISPNHQTMQLADVCLKLSSDIRIPF